MNVLSRSENLKKRIGIPLLIWGAVSMVAGVFYFISNIDLIKGVLLQAFFWGLIDFILGLVPFFGKIKFDLEKIKKIFLINTYLDILYIAVGILLMLLSGNSFIIGNGLGVIIQGSFLFIVDLLHYKHIEIN
jgi:hypothetical protein